jgi:hypothetical protein
MEEKFSPQDSLLLIQAMIDKTKVDLGENRIYFLFWGWLSFVAILGQFFLKVVVQYKHHYLVWLMMVPAVIITVIYSLRQHKKKQKKTYIGDSMSNLWTGVGVSFFVLSCIITMQKEGWNYSYPFFILLYGLGTFVSGKILQFRPLIIGGIFNWLLAIAASFVSFDYQLLFAAAALLTSYIIPGHLLPTSKNR